MPYSGSVDHQGVSAIKMGAVKHLAPCLFWSINRPMTAFSRLSQVLMIILKRIQRMLLPNFVR
ncbi:MAG: hypothetical protein VX987_01520 [Pseudomonadota bacterium]|nr:hypothetical protein [Pseudomonadota bacterium]